MAVCVRVCERRTCGCVCACVRGRPMAVWGECVRACFPGSPVSECRVVMHIRMHMPTKRMSPFPPLTPLLCHPCTSRHVRHPPTPLPHSYATHIHLDVYPPTHSYAPTYNSSPYVLKSSMTSICPLMQPG